MNTQLKFGIGLVVAFVAGAVALAPFRSFARGPVKAMDSDGVTFYSSSDMFVTKSAGHVYLFQINNTPSGKVKLALLDKVATP